MKFTLLAQPLLVATALAAPALISRQLATIQGEITKVQTALGNLATAVDVRTSSLSLSIYHHPSSHHPILTLTQAVSAADPATIQKVLTASTDTQTTIKTATTTVTGATALGLTDALSLQSAATALTASADKTVSALVAKKAVFDQLNLSGTVAQQLQLQKDGATALGSAIVSKVPGIGQGIAQSSIGQITTVLDSGLTSFGGAAAAAAAPAVPVIPGVAAGATTATGTAPATPATPVKAI